MSLRPPIQHCRECGSPVVYRLPDDGDNHRRAVCTACHTIHYENPLNVVGTVPLWEGQIPHSLAPPPSLFNTPPVLAPAPRVLLCQRNIEPRRGFWTLPAGFMELGESLTEGAMRETQEESGAQFELQGLFCIVTVAPVTQVHFFFRARLSSLQFNPGPETAQLALFTEDQIPWENMAFRTVKETLRLFWLDWHRQSFGVHCVEL